MCIRSPFLSGVRVIVVVLFGVADTWKARPDPIVTPNTLIVLSKTSKVYCTSHVCISFRLFILRYVSKTIKENETAFCRRTRKKFSKWKRGLLMTFYVDVPVMDVNTPIPTLGMVLDQ